MRDWVDWHHAYDDPDSSLSRRLDRVTWHLAVALDEARPGPIRLLSLCAGQGRDVLRVQPRHRRRHDVSAVLIESDPRNARLAREGHRRPPDVTTQMRSWFAAAGFEEVAFEALDTDYLTSVGVHRLAERRERQPDLPCQPLFTFGSQLP